MNLKCTMVIFFACLLTLKKGHLHSLQISQNFFFSHCTLSLWSILLTGSMWLSVGGGGLQGSHGYLLLHASCFPAPPNTWYPELIPTINISINIPIDTWSTLYRHLIDQQSVNSQLSVNLIIWIKWKLVKCQWTVWQTVKQDVHGVSIKCQPRCWWRVSRVSMECWKGWSRVSMRVQINIQLLYLSVTIAWSTSKDH